MQNTFYIDLQVKQYHRISCKADFSQYDSVMNSTSFFSSSVPGFGIGERVFRAATVLVLFSIESGHFPWVRLLLLVSSIVLWCSAQLNLNHSPSSS